MSRRLTAKSVSWLGLFLFVGPFLVLPVQAAADIWRFPALWPQKLGSRGLTTVLDDPTLPRAIFNSALVAICATAVAIVVAWPAARSMADKRSAALAWRLGLLAPLLLPPLVVGQGLAVWFIRLGLADTIFGLVIAHLVFVVPYVAILLMPGFNNECSEREQVAASLGATWWLTFRTVTFPATRTALGLAAALGFTVSWSQYGSSLGIGGGIPMLPLVLVPFARSDPQVAAVLDLIFVFPPLATFVFALRARPNHY